MLQGTLFLDFVLVTHGNWYLAGNPLLDFFPQHSAFRFVEFARFTTWSGQVFAEDVNAWFEKLKTASCQGIRVHWLPSANPQFSDRMTVGLVGGGGRRLIETIYPHGSDLWEAGWEVRDRNHPEQKIWNIHYRRMQKNSRPMVFHDIDIEKASRELCGILQRAVALTRKHELDFWRQAFETGLQNLEAMTEPDLEGIALQNQLSLPEAKLLAAAQSSWVFGGMGSWNDIGFDGQDQKEYESISNELFRLLRDALPSVVNRSCPKIEKMKSPWWKFW